MNDVNLRGSVGGRFKIEAFRADPLGSEVAGSRRVLSGWSKNLITDAGLNRMGDNADYMTWCQVGSGTTPPSPQDGSLVARIAGSNTAASVAGFTSPSAPHYTSVTKTYRFAAGIASGNISEVGVGWASTASLFSRALVRDAQGNPATITVLPDEFLDVTYEFRYYAPTADLSGSITLDGVTHAWVSRAARVTDGGVGQGIGWTALDTNATGNGVSAGLTSLGAEARGAYSGGITQVTGTPSGIALPGAQTAAAYSNGSLQRSHTLSFDLSQGNVPDGIGAICLKAGIGVYQIGFTPKINKTADKVLSLTVTHSWARRP